MNRYFTQCVGCVLVVLALPLSAAYAASTWTTLTGCTLLHQQDMDGDTFYIEHQGSNMAVRLYFVDAPELNLNNTALCEQQAAYWELHVEDMPTLGALARQYVMEKLKHPFTVYTQWRRGSEPGKPVAYLAYIKPNGSYLCELLVQQGFARISGVQAEMPTGADAQLMLQSLERAEREARQNKKGAWTLYGQSGGVELTEPASAEDEIIGRTFQVKKPVPVFSLKASDRRVGLLKRGSEVTIVAHEPNDMVRVRFSAPEGDRLLEAQCRLPDIIF